MAKWSTEKVNELIRQIESTGVTPNDNPFYEKDIRWRKANIDFIYTKEELLELAKCQINILHFAEKHCEVMTDSGNRKVNLRNYQRRIILQLKKFRMNVWLASRQIGKCVTFDTLVEIYDKNADTRYTLPIFEVHYFYKKNKDFLDYVEWKLYKLLYIIKQKMLTYELRISK